MPFSLQPLVLDEDEGVVRLLVVDEVHAHRGWIVLADTLIQVRAKLSETVGFGGPTTPQVGAGGQARR
ncbi:MAG: hypothetical protein M3451_07535 [Chloroflexota bacterium]|nr:hypothetical protein [Chloroflexota bacterium]